MPLDKIKADGSGSITNSQQLDLKQWAIDAAEGEEGIKVVVQARDLSFNKHCVLFIPFKGDATFTNITSDTEVAKENVREMIEKGALPVDFDKEIEVKLKEERYQRVVERLALIESDKAMIEQQRLDRLAQLAEEEAQLTAERDAELIKG